MPTTRDPIGEFVDLPEADASPTEEGQIGYRSGAFEMRDSVGVFDPRSGGGGLTEATHRAVDQLVHLVAEDSFTEFVYSGNKITDIIVWTDSGKTTKIREETITYSGNQVSTVVTKQYDGATLEETYTETYSYTGNQIDDITGALT